MSAVRGGRTVLVTGGGGFLGRAIVERLVARGDRVRSISRGAYPDLELMGVECTRADLADAEALRRACDGCDVVFHAAARAGVWGSFESFYSANVVGTRNVIAACRSAGVRVLVYTSSPSVVFDGRDMKGVDESVPYPEKFHAHYPRTKAEAERMVLAANERRFVATDLRPRANEREPSARDRRTPITTAILGSRASFATVALRPHLIWGPRDNHLVPRIIARGRRLRRIGCENKLVDSTYIDNAAEAHILAADRLLVEATGRPFDDATERAAAQSPAGRAYFISNGEPRPVWDLVNAILAAANLPPVRRRIPRGVAWIAGALLESIYATLRLPGEPQMTRFLAEELSTAHWFDITAARRDFGYSPCISIDEGLELLSKWLARRAK